MKKSEKETINFDPITGKKITESKKSAGTSKVKTKNLESKEETVVTPTASEVTVVEQKSKKGERIALTLLIILLLVAIGGCLYYFVFNKQDTKKIYENKIVELYNKVDEKLEDSNNIEYLENPTKISMDFKIDLSNEISSLLGEDIIKLTDYTYSFEAGLDLKNQKAMGSISFSDGNKEILGASAYLLKNIAYIDLHDLANYLIKYELDESIWNEINLDEIKSVAVSKDDLKVLNKFMKDYLVSILNNGNITDEKEDITIDDAKISATKRSIKYTSEDCKKIYSDLIDQILKNKDVLDILKKSTDEDIEQKLNNAKEDIDEKFNNDYSFEIVLYTKGNDVVKYEAYVNDELLITITDYKDVTTISILNDNEVAEIKITEDKDLYTAILSVDNEKILSIKMTENDKETKNGIITFYVDKEEISLKYDVTNKDDSGKIVLTLMYSGMTFGSLTADYTISENTSFDDINTNNSKTKLTDDELNEIQNKIFDKIQETPFYNILVSSTL